MSTPTTGLLSLGEAAQALHCQTWHIRRLEQLKIIRLPKIGRDRVVPTDQLEDIGRKVRERYGV